MSVEGRGRVVINDQLSVNGAWKVHCSGFGGTEEEGFSVQVSASGAFS